MNIFAAAFHHLCFFSNDFPRLSTTFHDLCSLSLAECRNILLVNIPILLQGAALVAVRHGWVTNFPSGVRTATRAAPCKWPIRHTKDRRALCVLSFSEAITPRLNKLRGSARKYIRRCENRLASQQGFY